MRRPDPLPAAPARSRARRAGGSTRLADGLALAAVAAVAALNAGCPSGGGGGDEGVVASATAESCMTCHNGSAHDDYGGPGLENPHPYGGAGTLKCTVCHGGDPSATDPLLAHVPAPPEVGDRAFQDVNAKAYFNRLTLTGIDKFADYEVNGQTYSALDYLQFVNPGDLRVTAAGRSCGICHAPHSDFGNLSLLATSGGVLSGAKFSAGDVNAVPASQGLYEDTASDLAFRAVSDPGPSFEPDGSGAVPELIEAPVFSVHGQTGPMRIFRNRELGQFLAADLNDDVDPVTGAVIPGSPLSALYQEQVAFTCGNCHLGSSGANNRYGDFRSSGCTACHMRYSQDGRSRSTDPNINKLEPLDVDDIDDPERPHVNRHLLVNTARTLTSGERVQGIDDFTCAGCHQGSNRTVMQYWGIRLDQNQDLRRGVQYPANPQRTPANGNRGFLNTANDTRLFDPVVGNRTFNGRNANQYILFEDYDGDGRDDTPADVHYEAGLGCIDCHTSADLHGGQVGDLGELKVLSHMEQAVGVRCETCHGTISAYASTTRATAFDGVLRDVVVDRKGTPLNHVVRESEGHYFLTSKLTGERHYVPQTRDTVNESTKTNPLTGEVIYNPKASYAMGRVDADPTNGVGPIQAATGSSTLPVTPGFSHTDDMNCVSCHAAWTNTCTGCHLKGEYDEGNNFSNITGDRIVYRETNADFTFQNPWHFQLGVDTHDKVAVITTSTKVFYQYKDIDGNLTRVFAFSDRAGEGNNPGTGQPGDPNPRSAHPALAHNIMMPHSIRGRVTAQNEGPRYCVACHLTTEGLATFGAEYAAFRQAMATTTYDGLDFAVLRQHFGQNPGNQLNSPLWVHNVVGLGSGLFLFDDKGAPVNPIDEDANRVGAEGVAPATQFLTDGFTKVRYNLDRIVEPSGVANGSNAHQLLSPPVGGSSLRDGALDPQKAGPFGATLIRRLSDPDAPDRIVLDAWIDADGELRGALPSLLAP